MAFRSYWAVGVAVILSCVAVAQESSTTVSQGRDLLRASAPGAYSVRYLPDRALVATSAETASELRVYMPAPPLWGYVDGDRKPGAYFKWDPAGRCVVLSLDADAHSLQIGWEGKGRLPRPDQKIALLIDGKRAGELTARFTLEKMTAEGSVELPFGVGRVWADPSGALSECLGARLRIGNEEITEWRRVRGRLQGRGHVALGGTRLMTLTLPAYNLLETPMEAIDIEPLSISAGAKRVTAMPEEGVLVEAEDFVAQGSGNALISEGDHIDQHGGKSVYTFTGNGHWIEWEFTVPEDGEYDLFAKISCGEDMSFREVRVDGSLPARAFRLVQFPGTGGWAHAPGEWWFMQIAGGSDALPPLRLRKGTHTLRLKGVFEYHLNVDYFMLTKR